MPRTGRPPRPALERFNEKVRVDPQTGCHVWTAALDKDGYARFTVETGTTIHAARWAYEAVNGPIPFGLTIDHLCRNRACVNAAHLEAVTVGVNVLRGENPAARNKRKTRCKYGHPLAGANVHTYQSRHRTNPGRYCRECKRVANRRGRSIARGLC